MDVRKWEVMALDRQINKRIQASLLFDTSVTSVSHISSTRAKALAKLDITTIGDLLFHFPFRYLDVSSVVRIASAQIGSNCSIPATVFSVQEKRVRSNLTLIEMTLVDGSDTLMVSFFSMPWIMRQYKSGMQVLVAGKIEFSYGFKRMVNPYIEIIEPGKDIRGRIFPLHHVTSGISVTLMRSLVAHALEMVRGSLDYLPSDFREKYRLYSLYSALCAIHFPHSMEEAHNARRRFKYEEVLLFELFLFSNSRKRFEGKQGVRHVQGALFGRIADYLPFSLSPSQLQAVSEITQHMCSDQVMNHLLLGDVGTGKTIVAGHALVLAVDSGMQAVLMAPTEILAKQHARSLGSLFDLLGISWGFLTSSVSSEERKRLLEGCAEGSISILIGTHALIESDVIFHCLSLAVIDEQQRFGVQQRQKLLLKGEVTDALYLTATPIPRSLAYTLFGDMSLSYLQLRSDNVAQRKTFVHRKEERGIAYDAAKEALRRGEKVYVVCPLVGENTTQTPPKKSSKYRNENEASQEEVANESKNYIDNEQDYKGGNLVAATKHTAFLSQGVFIDYEVGLLHGKMSAEEKDQMMKRFLEGDVQVLVATTVIEVGVDVADATVMIVEDADRFGLSQLHQLRGRIGRGNLDAQFHMVSSSTNKESLNRLQAMVSFDDGYKLASIDLEQRHEGDLLGNKQHGVSTLKLTNVAKDEKLIAVARRDAQLIIDNDPELSLPRNSMLAYKVRKLNKGRTH